ncbi:hypothetical protein EV201_1271 [Ancylomarina subtilis]|uniref:Uncharacterized protein n=1 Tax=Ancylomarina subtilis TaxID=1639035 RepID=A0A4Q7VK77_9BACT|nr:hypothetical protein [Ancylomarina subtilis]RZT96630.1 hypothetical protein EV201_1271 [Ancylomarina subtilis]
MSISINTINKLITVYSGVKLTAYETTATRKHTYTFKVYINDALEYELRPKANLENKGVLDIESILSKTAKSKVFYNSSNLFETNNTALIKYKVDIECKDLSGSTVSSTSTGDLFALNGVKQVFERQNINDYLMISTVSKGSFLTKCADKLIATDSKSYLTAINGNFGFGSNPSFTGIRVKATDYDGQTRTTTANYSNTNPELVSIDVSIDKLNSISGTFITENTNFYTVEELSGKSNPIKYTITREKKIKQTFNFLYVNSLGAVDSFDFTKVSEESLNIKRSVFENQSIHKAYNTTATQKFRVYSDFINEVQSIGLIDLWITPKIILHEDDLYNEVILGTKAIKPLRRINEKMINYPIDFSYASAYKTQKY